MKRVQRLRAEREVLAAGFKARSTIASRGEYAVVTDAEVAPVRATLGVDWRHGQQGEQR